MPQELSRFVVGQPPFEPLLPLLHGTDSYTFNLIRASSSLEPRYCEVFKENLVYLFYGRPGYRVATSSGSRSDQILCPVCFIFKPTAVSQIERIYPFDTGAFEAGKYKGFIHDAMGRDTFLLGSTLDLPQRVVTTFFGDNTRYFLGRYTRDLTFTFGQMELQVYYELLSATGQTEADDRRYTIELQSKQAVQLTTNLLAVILPDAALDDKNVVASLGAWGAEYRTYPTVTGFRPGEYHGVVVGRVMDFLMEKKFL